VGSAEEALAAAADGSFCAALVDKNLIGASGLGLARTLRKLHPELEVILMSGYASIESALEAMQIGAFDYVTKPIEDYASLSMKLQNAVDKSLLVRQHRALIRNLFDSEPRSRSTGTPRASWCGCGQPISSTRLPGKRPTARRTAAGSTPR
jgi:two-component system, cell cycle sensor histidine kinase and response regulator CckA